MRFVTLVNGDLATRRIFTGYVSADLLSNKLPAGWSVTKSNSVYTVTHNLNLASPADLVGSVNVVFPTSNFDHGEITAATNNTVVISGFRKEGTPKDISFVFTAIQL